LPRSGGEGPTGRMGGNDKNCERGQPRPVEKPAIGKRSEAPVPDLEIAGDAELEPARDRGWVAQQIVLLLVPVIEPYHRSRSGSEADRGDHGSNVVTDVSTGLLEPAHVPIDPLEPARDIEHGILEAEDAATQERLHHIEEATLLAVPI